MFDLKWFVFRKVTFIKKWKSLFAFEFWEIDLIFHALGILEKKYLIPRESWFRRRQFTHLVQPVNAWKQMKKFSLAYN